MPNMSVRNIPEEEFDALKRIAQANNRSAEAEVRHAISNLVRAQSGHGLGTLLNARYGGLIDDDFEFERDKTTSEPITFE